MRQAPVSIRILATLLVCLQVFSIVLTVWWGMLLLREDERVTAAAAQRLDLKTQSPARTRAFRQMVIWEGISFVAAIMTTTLIIFAILLRDRRRALALQRFFASFAHELRAPITSVILQADTLQGETPGNRTGVLFKRLLRQTRRLDDQLGQALRIARHIEGRPLSTEPLGLDGLLQRFRKERKELLTGFQLNMQGPPGLQIWADAEGFFMILRNLVENTRRHSGLAEPKAQLTWEASDRQVRFVFSDLGKGSPRNHRGEWPEPGESSSGAGMGLFLTRSLSQGMGGGAHFEGRQGGFRVFFHFPRGHFSRG